MESRRKRQERGWQGGSVGNIILNVARYRPHIRSLFGHKYIQIKNEKSPSATNFSSFALGLLAFLQPFDILPQYAFRKGFIHNSIRCQTQP